MSRLFLACALSVFCFNGAAQGYFQQEVNYFIDVALDDVNHQLNGNIEIEYINNSSDTLHYLYMHTWPNAYSSLESAMAKQAVKTGSYAFQFSDLKDRGSITDINYTINGIPAFYDSIDVDIQKLNLPEPLPPGKSISIHTPFLVKIPSAEFSRLGHVEQSYQITQWYPKPAVYDSNGWHPMPYLSQGEFYSEFGNFEVTITLPKNYVLFATGDLQDENEKIWLNQLAERTSIIEHFDRDMSFPESAAETKTLTFSQSKVHDFAWFADKRYHVLKSEVTLPYSGKVVETWAAFTNMDANFWKKSTEYLDDAVYYYSLWNGEYPFNHATAVDGTISAGGGMEYPTITVIGNSYSPIELETVIMHEVGHNWFYGILATNERENAWMDEGINSANELRYLELKHPSLNLFGGTENNRLLKMLRLHRLSYKDEYQMSYLLNARRNLDQPLNIASPFYTSFNYGAIVYSKSAVIFNYLRSYLGDKAYDQMMQSYFDAWKFKHPLPDDFQKYIAKELNDKDDWFKNLINTTQKADYKIAGLRKQEGGYELKIRSVGKIKGPVSYSILNKSDSVLVTEWIQPFNKIAIESISENDFRRIVLDYERVSPDRNRKNNEIKRSGVFRKVAPIRFQWLAGMEEPERTTLYCTPIIGYNTSDGFMSGLLLHNYSLFQKEVEFKLAPMFGFRSDAFNWMGSVRYNFRFQENRIIENAWIQINSSSFSTSKIPDYQRFEKYTASGNLDFKRNPLNKNLSHSIYYAYNYIVEGSGSFESTQNSTNEFGFLSYTIKNSLPIRPYSLTAGFELNELFDRFTLESKIKFVYNSKNRSIKTRLFYGAFMYNDESNNNARYNFRMDGINGNTDYTYKHTFIGRYDQDNLFAQQFVEGHGNFKVPTAYGQSNEWLFALNIKIESPVKIPVGIFTDIGLNTKQAAGIPNIFYNAGFYIWLVPDAVEVYFPILFSKVIREEHKTKELDYPSLIRFMINFNEINPFNLLKNIAH